MPCSRSVLMISSAGLPSAIACSRSSPRPLPSPSTIRRCSRSLTGRASSSAARSALVSAVVTPSNSSRKVCSGSYAGSVLGGRAPAVVDHVERHPALLVGDPVHRHDLRRVHDRGVQAGLDALVEEDRVQHHAGGRVEAEGDVGQPEGGLHVGEEPLDLADGLDRLDPVAAGLLLAGGDREGEAVDDDVAAAASPSSRQVLDDPGGHRDLPVRGAGLALLVDGQRHHGRAVLLRPAP